MPVRVIGEEDAITAFRRTVNLGPVFDRPVDGLVEQLQARIAPLGDVKPLGTNVGDF